MRKADKRLIAILLLLLAAAALWAADTVEQEETRRFQLQNTFIGFGAGSRRQGDMLNADKLLRWDLAGTTLTIGGAAGLAASIFTIRGLRATYGDVTNADIYISAGVLASGLIIIVINRINGYRAPLDFR